MDYFIKCWTGIHILYMILSIFGVLLLLICLIFLNCFYFYPFLSETSTIKLNSTLDIILLLMKFIYVIRLVFIINENISLLILLLLSFFLLMKELRNPTYNSILLKTIINIRKFLIVWTFFILFIAKLCEKTEINGLIYLVFSWYPIIIVISIIFTQEYGSDFTFNNSNLHNIKYCLSKTRIFIKLINSFLEKNNNNFKYFESGVEDDILLKGLIKIHTERCLNEVCPLKKFLKNDVNFNIQKQCLLNYMTIYLTKIWNIFLTIRY